MAAKRVTRGCALRDVVKKPSSGMGARVVNASWKPEPSLRYQRMVTKIGSGSCPGASAAGTSSTGSILLSTSNTSVARE